MSPIVFEIVIIIMLILANGVLALSEMAIVSSRKSRLHQLAESGDRGAQAALEISNSPNEFLSTVQIGITLVGILAGAFGGATLGDELAAQLKTLPHIPNYAPAIAIFIVVGSITYLSLIIGELVPKRLALHAPEKVARVVAQPMQFLSRIAKPIVWVLSTSTSFIVNLFGLSESNDPQVTEAEIHVLVGQAAEAGVVEESEQEMVAEVLRLGDRKVTALMTPRTEIAWLDVNDTLDEILQEIDSSSHTRFPVADMTLDVVLGIVESKTILRLLHKQKTVNLRELILEPLYVPETTTALNLLESFRDAKLKMALVLNEYGGLQGLVTGQDIFRTIVGEFQEVGDEPKWETVQRDDGSWLLDGQMPIDEFEDLVELNLHSNEQHSYQTVAGFILAHLERIPKTGETFEWSGLHFEIVDLDRHRIDKLLVKKVDKKDEKKDGKDHKDSKDDHSRSE